LLPGQKGYVNSLKNENAHLFEIRFSFQQELRKTEKSLNLPWCPNRIEIGDVKQAGWRGQFEETQHLSDISCDRLTSPQFGFRHQIAASWISRDQSRHDLRPYPG
jgi:hypothetical protein